RGGTDQPLLNKLLQDRQAARPFRTVRGSGEAEVVPEPGGGNDPEGAHGAEGQVAAPFLGVRQGVVGRGSVAEGPGQHPRTQIVRLLAPAPPRDHQLAGGPENLQGPAALLGAMPVPRPGSSAAGVTL